MSERAIGVAAVSTPAWPAVTGALADAFADDPVFAWLLPDPVRRPAALRRYFAVESRRVMLPLGRSVRAERDGVTIGATLVAPPGQWRTPIGALALHAPQYVRAFGVRTVRASQLVSALEARHAVHAGDPHVYFPYIGVVPSAQGAGVGRALVSSVLEGCDDAGLPAYLEASNPRCAVLYERLGFRGVEEFAHRSCPPLRLMRRDPR